jgi:DNA modification methylase
MVKHKNSNLYPERILKELKLEDLDFRTRHKVIFSDSRSMDEVDDESIHLIVTSPPYPMIEMWDDLFRDLDCNSYDKMHEYLLGVWKECYRVLINGGITCINIGDATRKIKGKFRLYSNHSKIIQLCEEIGFMSLPYILWKKPIKKPNAFLGSGFLPTNAYVTLDCEYILIFRKGNLRKFKVKDPYRYASYYSKEKRDLWFSQIWTLTGAKQENDLLYRRTAAFPEELAYRLIRMFSIIGDFVLDPFLGTGTTTKVAIETNRNSIGYEFDPKLEDLIKNKIFKEKSDKIRNSINIEFLKRIR